MIFQNGVKFFDISLASLAGLVACSVRTLAIVVRAFNSYIVEECVAPLLALVVRQQIEQLLHHVGHSVMVTFLSGDGVIFIMEIQRGMKCRLRLHMEEVFAYLIKTSPSQGVGAAEVAFPVAFFGWTFIPDFEALRSASNSVGILGMTISQGG